MFLNYGSGGSGSGGNSTINITGSTNSIKNTIAEMNSIPSPKNGDVCYVRNTKELYMFSNGTWEVIPTGDMFYNKLSSTTQIGHVQLTSDITLDSEDKAITPKALNTAINEVKLLINQNPNGGDGWGDFDDGIDDGEGENGYEWNEW